jgi:small redox-active disulfide protein 2
MTTVTVLGPRCKRCAALEAVTRDAVAQLGLAVTVEKVTDYAEIARMGVMSTPALAIDGRLALSGSVPGVDRVKQLLAADA